MIIFTFQSVFLKYSVDPYLGSWPSIPQNKSFSLEQQWLCPDFVIAEKSCSNTDSSAAQINMVDSFIFGSSVGTLVVLDLILDCFFALSNRCQTTKVDQSDDVTLMTPEFQ